MEIRDSLATGEPFEVVARAVSDDPSAKINHGNLGYFTALQTPYEFENAVYHSEPGEISLPVRTHFGYHIIRVNEKIDSRGKLKVAHIMTGFNQYDEPGAKELAARLHGEITAGYSFEDLAEKYSSDFHTSSNGGRMEWFGTGRMHQAFEEMAFALSEPGEISEPVLTPWGWHIIKLIDRRDIPPYEEVRDELLERVSLSGSSRSAKIRNALTERLKSEWGFSENPGALEIFYRHSGDGLYSPATHSLEEALFSIGGSDITRREFAEFISKNIPFPDTGSVVQNITELYNGFVNMMLIRLEEKNLEKKIPEFRHRMNEYRNSMLLHEISDREVWSRARSDSVGLAGFFLDNKGNYIWDTRVLATIFTAPEMATARRIAWRARRSNLFGSRDSEWVIAPLTGDGRSGPVTFSTGLFCRGYNEVVDLVPWETGVSEIIYFNSSYNVVMIHEIHDPEYKSLDEAYEEIVADYRDHLESRWLEKLRETYNIKVNRDVLSDFY
jgi:peptidyl-prolyl cis-trans isomerase SurA